MTAQHSNSPLRVAHCHAGRITDATLDKLEQVGRKAQNEETLTDTEGALLLLCLPQICHELRQRRAAMDLISDCTDLDNVRFLSAERA